MKSRSENGMKMKAKIEKNGVAPNRRTKSRYLRMYSQKEMNTIEGFPVSSKKTVDQCKCNADRSRRARQRLQSCFAGKQCALMEKAAQLRI